MAKHDDAPTPRDVDAADAVDDEVDAFRAVWQTDSAGEQAGSFWVEAPNFPVVRRGYRREQVMEFVTQASRRIRSLEMQLEEQRQEEDWLRSVQEEFGDADGLVARVDALQEELDQARAALDAARQEAESARGAGAERDDRAAALEAELENAREELAATKEQLTLATARLDSSLGQGGGADAYGAIAAQIADLIRSAGLQADQIRREATEEGDRVLSQARMEAGDMVREAQIEADAFRVKSRADADRVGTEREEILRRAREEGEALKKEAQEQADRVGADREEVLRQAREEAARIQGNAETDAKRRLEQAERELARAKADSDRMLGAGISRRDLVRAEMLALRERLVGAMALLDLGAETESGPTQATLDLERDVVDIPGADQADDQSVA